MQLTQVARLKGATHIVDTICETIKKVGSRNVVQVVTNYNTTICKSARRIIEDKYPHYL
jgi:hypothetical protein